MARKLRIQFPGAIYHVTIRGNGQQRIFLDEQDRKRLVTRLAESVETYNVNLYLFSLMINHLHLVVETPDANLARFMQSVETGYTVYFNLRHNRSGHVMQGRYGAKLVEGNEYLLNLSRYVHLNSVFTVVAKKLSLEERIEYLRKYQWSSYPSYIGKMKQLDFVKYEPILGLMGGRKVQSAARYREFVESGIAKTDEEFLKVLKGSQHSIGRESFRRWVNELYIELLEKKETTEDVSFRKTINRLSAKKILVVVSEQLGISDDELNKRRRGSVARPIAAQMLCKYGGLTQREVAAILNVRTGTGISLQIRKFKEKVLKNRKMRKKVEQIQRRLEKERSICG